MCAMRPSLYLTGRMKVCGCPMATLLRLLDACQQVMAKAVAIWLPATAQGDFAKASLSTMD